VVRFYAMLGVTSVVCALSLLAAAEEGSWAVIGLAGSGVWATDLERVEDGLRQSLTRARAGRLQPRAATAALLNEARQAGLVCDVHEPACAAKLGASAGVDRVLVLDASAQAPRLLVKAVVIDVSREVEIARAQRDVDGAAPEATVLDALALELAAPEKFFGAIHVVGLPEGSRVLIDGAAPRAPLDQPQTRIQPGVHVVEVISPRGTWKAVIDVARGTVTQARPVFPAPAPVPTAPTATAAAPVPAPMAADGAAADRAADVVAAVEEPASGFPLGLALAAGGGAALVVGGIGAGALAVALESPQDPGTREGLRAGGVALLGLAVLGAVVGATGAGLWLMEDGS
jgi:hypothetical protein